MLCSLHFSSLGRTGRQQTAAVLHYDFGVGFYPSRQLQTHCSLLTVPSVELGENQNKDETCESRKASLVGQKMEE